MHQATAARVNSHHESCMGRRGFNSPSSSNGNIHTGRFFHTGHFRNLAALVGYRIYGIGYMV
jgi:hypothetical protein